MQKENKYQKEAQNFLERQFEVYHGQHVKIYEEEFSTIYDDVLQECSPLIGGYHQKNSVSLKEQYSIIGLREKIKEFNEISILDFLKKHKRIESVDDVVELMFQDFKKKYFAAENEAQLYQLIFTSNQDLKNNLRREIFFSQVKENLAYNVIYYEKAGCYARKNSFYTIKERRIPVSKNNKQSERPDFLHYINGIPLVLIEYKTEDSGILKSLKDFEFKESYRKAPFKIALNDGRDVIFFSDISFLKMKSGKDNSFHWVHYLPEKKHIRNGREFTNIEYLFDELLCQPENLYSYCIDGCSVVNSNSHYYLINARIQQYYAIKDIKKTLKRVMSGHQVLPYNFEFAHAQRSGKTITMKLISYMIEKSFLNIFNSIFMYTPDLQIKDVIFNEFSKSGNSSINIQMVETRLQYQEILDSLYYAQEHSKEHTGLSLYIVNMQKITDKELQDVNPKIINTSKILNIIDEAHHGQTKETALIRQSIFPNASNYLFTATGKSDMYLFYFPDNQRNGYHNKFTISNAKQCKITVPVMFLKADKIFKLSDKIHSFSKEVEKRLEQQYLETAKLIGLSEKEINVEEYLEKSNQRITLEIRKEMEKGSMAEKLNAIVDFMNSSREGLPFFPKAIMYTKSVEDAKKYIEFIQQSSINNEYKGYRFGVDFSSIEKICSVYNPGIHQAEEISSNFQKERVDNKDNTNVIDILLAVDKYQKGFDLPTLLVTFLDTNISEPARMNQIFTRSATKFTGKTIGYCVDLTLDSINPDTFKQSLLLYDNINDLGDGFLNDDLVDGLKEVLMQEFTKLREVLNLHKSNFTASMILQQVLNESDKKLREKRQASFFYITKSIISSLGKLGSPVFFKPFKLELKALNDAFHEFKRIYADKNHPEHYKILINTDHSFDDAQYITNDEIKSIISEVLNFIQENHITDIISFQYKEDHQEIMIDENSQNEVMKKFSQELKKNNIEKDFDNISDYLSKHHTELLEYIKNMLNKISDDRSLIYDDSVQDELTKIEAQLHQVKKNIIASIQSDFNGHTFLFWSNQVLNRLFERFGIIQPDFSLYISKEVYKNMQIIFPEIEINLSNFEKVQNCFIKFKEKFPISAFSFYLTDFNKHFGLSTEFKEQIKNAPKVNDCLLMAHGPTFERYLKESLKYYYQN